MQNSRMRSLNSAATRYSCTEDARQVGDAQTGLENKVTLIFGYPVDGVRALALALARKGSDVIILTSRANQEETDDLKGQIEVCGQRSEICEETEINQQVAQGIVQEILERFGRLDVYIDYSGHSLAVDGRHLRERRGSSVHPGLALMKAAFPHITKAAGPMRQCSKSDKDRTQMRSED